MLFFDDNGITSYLGWEELERIKAAASAGSDTASDTTSDTKMAVSANATT